MPYFRSSHRFSRRNQPPVPTGIKDRQAAIMAAYLAEPREPIASIAARFGCSKAYPAMLAGRAGVERRQSQRRD